LKRVLVCLFLLGALAESSLAGTVTFLSSPATVVDSAHWSSIGPDLTPFSNNQTVNTVSSNVVTIGLGTQPSLGGITSVVCNPSPVNCSWGDQPSGFSSGDTLLWLEGQDSNGNPVGTGPLTLTLLNPVGGLGLYFQTVAAGAFSATFNVYNGLVLLGTHNYNSNGSGDPLFVGAQDTTTEITKAVLTVNTCGSFDCDAHDFSADTLDIFRTSSNVPEPATFAFAATVMTFGLGFRKRLGKGRSQI
jgi:hypothetical protein